MSVKDLRFEFIPTAVCYELANDWDTIPKKPCQNDLKEGLILRQLRPFYCECPVQCWLYSLSCRASASSPVFWRVCLTPSDVLGAEDFMCILLWGAPFQN